MRIAVSKGHNVYYQHGSKYIFDPGATKYPHTEADITNSTVDILIPLLRAKGHEVLDVTPLNQKFEDKKSAHEARSKKIKAWKPDLYLDIHMNAGGGTGPECWVYSTKSKAYDPARKIVNSLEKATGLRNRGIKVKAGFWSLSLHEAPSIIVEGAFMDSPNGQDLKVLTPQIYAQAIADTFEDISKPETVKPEIVDVKYRVRKDWSKPETQKGAFGLLTNAIERVEQLGDDYKVFDLVGKQVYPVVSKNTYDDHFNSLNAKGIVVHEKRYNDNITRGEMMALLDRATDIKK